MFNKIVEDYYSFVRRLDIPDIKPIPISALKGDNVVENTNSMPWYKGGPLFDSFENVTFVSVLN